MKNKAKGVYGILAINITWPYTISYTLALHVKKVVLKDRSRISKISCLVDISINRLKINIFLKHPKIEFYIRLLQIQAVEADNFFFFLIVNGTLDYY